MPFIWYITVGLYRVRMYINYKGGNSCHRVWRKHLPKEQFIVSCLILGNTLWTQVDDVIWLAREQDANQQAVAFYLSTFIPGFWRIHPYY